MPIIQSVARALTILDLFHDHATELKITDISELMGLHKSTVHSLLKTLQEYRYIDQNPDNGKYKLGMKLVERGNFVTSTMDIRKIANTHLLNLSMKTGQTTHLGILDGKEGVYIDKVDGPLALIRYSRIGKRIPLHSTAVGKVLLAFQDTNKTKKILENYVYTEQTKYSVTNENDLYKELENVAKQGYAIDNQENELGVQCIAVPIYNHTGQVTAAISMSSIISRITEEELRDYIELLKGTGKDVSREMGYRLLK